MLHFRSRLSAGLRDAVWIASLVLTVLAGAGRIKGQSPQHSASVSVRDEVTFNRDIAPIMFHSCAICHRPGEAAPFSLLTYSDAKQHAHQIMDVTRSRLMPPWLPEQQAAKFVDDLRLSAQEIDLITRWVKGGALEGDAVDRPAQPKFVEGWTLGEPDIILTAEKPFILPAEGSDVYWNFIFRVPIQETRWVKAVEIRPGDKRYVHHANILVDRAGVSRVRETEPGAGFGGMEIRIESQVFDPDSHLLFWKPGTIPYTYPDGMALRLDKGTDMVLNTHMQPSGKPEVIQPSIGLYFTPQPATKLPMLLQLENDVKLDIPAGDKSFLVTDDFALPIDVDLLALYPHAHYLGKDLQAYATLPDGSKRALIHIPAWNLNWQAVYRYSQPMRLPKGTTVSLHYVYDNSAENPMNPNRPPVRVLGGNRSRDEMCHLWLQVLPVNVDRAQGDPRMLLQETLARHNIEKDPGDFEAHYNLASMLQSKDRLDEAIHEYEAAVDLRPKDATANNALGAALVADKKPAMAAPYLQTAIESRSDYFDAHYNLGIALVQLGKTENAAQQFETALKLQPDDAAVEANLGAVLAEMGRLDQAKSHLERALQIDPDQSVAKENLEILQNLLTKQHPRE